MKYLLIATLLLLPACATQKTTLTNDQGDTRECGTDAVTGSLAGGLLGYYIQKSMNDDCMEKAKADGYDEN